MTELEKNQIRQVLRKSPHTIWGYWPFVVPIIVVLFGVAVQIAILSYFKHRTPGLEVCLRLGSRVVTLWDSQLVKEAVLTVSLSVAATFGLLGVLAWRAFKQTALLKAAARDLGIDVGH